MKSIQQVALMLAGCLFAAHPIAATPADAERLGPEWQALDANGDGTLALTEIPELGRAVYARSDLDGDGALSLAEYVDFNDDPGGSGRTPLPANVRLIADLPYAGTDDPRQRLDVYLPAEPALDGPLPVIAYLHGGAWRLGSRVMARAQVLEHVASGRYAAVSIGYRLSWQASWPAQIHDAKAGVRWIRAHAAEYGLDPARICAMGSSAGGHLAAVLGTTNGVPSVEGTLGAHLEQASDVQCAIDFFGPTDLTSFEHRQTDTTRRALVELLGGRPEALPERAREASPLHQVDARDPPFLIVHGTRDPLVPYAASVALAAALREAGVPVLFQSVEGGGHGDFPSAEVDLRVRAFLERTFHDPGVDVPVDPIVVAASAPANATVRFAADDALRTGMAGIRNAVAVLAHHEAGHLGAQQVLEQSGAIETQVDYLIANCRLEPQADATLHGIISHLLGATRALHDDPADAAPVAALRAALEEYSKRFDETSTID